MDIAQNLYIQHHLGNKVIYSLYITCAKTLRGYIFFENLLLIDKAAFNAFQCNCLAPVLILTKSYLCTKLSFGTFLTFLVKKHKVKYLSYLLRVDFCDLKKNH